MRRTVRARRAGKNRAAGFQLNVWHGISLLLGMLVMGVALFFFQWDPSHTSGKNRPLSTARPTATTTHMSWGDLEYTYLPLERPTEIRAEDFAAAALAKWVFKDYSAGELTNFFRRCGLPDKQLAPLLDTNAWQTIPGGFALSPPPEVVQNLGPEARQAIYSVLGKFRENPLHHMPFQIPAEGFESFFAGYDIPEARIEFLKKLSYGTGEWLYIADLPLIQKNSTPEEYRRIAKALSRVSTMLMRLRVDSKSDVPALINYWGQGGRGTAMKPFLESMTRVPGGSTIAIAYFLPEFARVRLYTYPNPEDKDVHHQDCFWTAMNFFREVPEVRFNEWDYTQKTLQSDYEPVRDNWTFGDVLLLIDGTTAFHMCVYIADNVVFTKNGVNLYQPWVLMKIPDMLALYPSTRLQLLGYRRKTP